MITRAIPTPSTATGQHTIWGLDAVELHDRFWAARGVQLVRPGEQVELEGNAELFVLAAPSVLAIFQLRPLIDQLSWIKPQVLYVRVHDNREEGYRERAVADRNNRFIRFERIYDCRHSNQARVALTPDRRLAEAWQQAPDAAAAWRMLRRNVDHSRRAASRIDGHIYDRRNAQDVVACIRALVTMWKRPDATIRGITRIGSNCWAAADTRVDPQTHFIGPVWIGVGRRLDSQAPVLGPAVLWDDPENRPARQNVRWEEIEPSEIFTRPVKPRQRSPVSQVGKRAFDIIFALVVLALTLPLYPLIMLAIYLEDGRPFFFTHRRETLGGKRFPCIKFRSMRKDADQIKQQFKADNKADGPQFYIENDPRLTRVGKFIRKTNLDEIPQFINVLLGDMSVVGPRPSPYEENQFCPAWREARLSVRPGVTGLWQVKRSRGQGLDFQEWIRFDIEYAENASTSLDLWIIWKTLIIFTRGLVAP